MPNPVPAIKPSRLLKPTLDTPYHIDFDWWNKASQDLHVQLRSHLCTVHRELYRDQTADTRVDWVDPTTAEVKSIDGILHTLRTHCSQQPDYITAQTSVVDAVFRVFLVNDNQPMTSRELSERIGKDAELILKTLSGKTVYQGIRPVVEGAK